MFKNYRIISKISFLLLCYSLVFSQNEKAKLKHSVISSGYIKSSTGSVIIGQPVSVDLTGKSKPTVKSGFFYTNNIKKSENKPSENSNDITITDIAPNPSNDNTTFFIFNPFADMKQIRISVIDVSGREIVIVFEGKLKPGETSFPFQSMNLPTGTYFCRVLTDDRSLIKMFDVIK